MAQPIHLNISGYGSSDGSCLPCSGVTGRAVNTSYSSRSDYKRISLFKNLSMNCASKGMSAVCNASSGSYRRNPDFPNQNRQGFSRSRNRQFEERDGSDNLEESEIFSSRNGTAHSVTGSPKYQATSNPGPREKEIVELFRKVQAQLRERAAMKEEKKKEEKKNEEPQVQQGKKSETVDSLLKLLRKHSVQQGKRSNNGPGSSRDFVIDQPELNVSYSAEKSSSIFNLNNIEKNKVQESEASSVSRPVSSFRRRSPVPQMKKQPNYVDEGIVNPILNTDLVGKPKDTSYLDREIEHKPRLNLKVDPIQADSEAELESGFTTGDMFDEMSDNETTEPEESHSDDDADEKNMSKHIDFNGMKLPELRALAKSRGLKGFSKLKKHELIKLLSED